VLLVGVLRVGRLTGAAWLVGLQGLHGVLDAALGLALLPGDALDVDPQQHVRAVPGPFGDLGCGDARVEAAWRRSYSLLISGLAARCLSARRSRDLPLSVHFAPLRGWE